MQTNSPNSSAEITRRRFLRETAVSAGAAGLSSSALAAAKADLLRDSPYRYDIEKLRQVDPKLIHFDPVTRFHITATDPRRLAIGANNRLHVAAGRNLLILDRDGVPVGQFAMNGEARSVAIASNETIFLGLRDHVEVFDAKGQRLAEWARLSGKPLITGIAVGESDVFLADAGNRIVWRCDRSGKVLHRIGEKDSRRNIPGFVVPSPFFDVELGADGLLRVTNPGRHRVEIYTREGELEAFWGKAGAGIEGFCGCCNPINIELLKDGRIVTFEKGLARVKIYSTGGELESVVAAPASFANALRDQCESTDCSFGGLDGAVAADGRIYVLDLITSDVQVFARKSKEA